MGDVRAQSQETRETARGRSSRAAWSAGAGQPDRRTRRTAARRGADGGVLPLRRFGEGWDGPQAQLFPVLFRPSAYGWLGVHLFFMISGFVICMSCWGRTVPDFFTSRVIRLFPAYWLGVLATTAVVTLAPGGLAPHAWRDVLVNLTMLQWPVAVEHVDGVYWTLWAEMRFYLLFALVVWRGLTYRRVVAFCCVWATAALLAKGYGSGPLSDLLMAQYCWFFIAGLAFYLIHRFGQNTLLWGIVALCFAMGQLTAVRGWRRTLQYVGHNVPSWGVAVLITLFFAVMAGVSLGWFRRVDWRWLARRGADLPSTYCTSPSAGRSSTISSTGWTAGRCSAPRCWACSCWPTWCTAGWSGRCHGGSGRR
ncbi:acyltransferase family protein [Streptomyces thermocarboxydus]